MPQVCMYTTDRAWISVLILRYDQVCSSMHDICWYMPQVCMDTTDHAWISVLMLSYAQVRSSMLKYAQVCYVCMIYVHIALYMPQVCTQHPAPSTQHPAPRTGKIIESCN